MVTPTSFTFVRLKEKESVFEIQQCTLCVCVVAAGSRMSIMDVCSQHTNRSAMLLMRDLALSCRQVDPSVKLFFLLGRGGTLIKFKHKMFGLFYQREEVCVQTKAA
jgi:hypothetical protein